MQQHPLDLSRHVQRWRAAPANLSPLVRQHLTASLAPGAVTPLKATARILRPHRGEMARRAAVASLTAVAGLAFGLWTGAR